MDPTCLVLGTLYIGGLRAQQEDNKDRGCSEDLLMDKEELEKEKKHSKEFFRLTMNGMFEDFGTLKDLMDFLLKNWDENYYASIRKLNEIPKEYAYKGR